MILLAVIFCVGCKKIQLKGMTFYTVTGKITDANNKAKMDLALNIYVEKEIQTFAGSSLDRVITASGKTDVDGNFKITYPKSDNDCYLMLQDGYQVIDSVLINSYTSNLVKLDNDKFNDYLLNIKTVKVSN